MIHTYNSKSISLPVKNSHLISSVFQSCYSLFDLFLKYLIQQHVKQSTKKRHFGNFFLWLIQLWSLLLLLLSDCFNHCKDEGRSWPKPQTPNHFKVVLQLLKFVFSPSNFGFVKTDVIFENTELSIYFICWSLVLVMGSNNGQLPILYKWRLN